MRRQSSVEKPRHSNISKRAEMARMKKSASQPPNINGIELSNLDSDSEDLFSDDSVELVVKKVEETEYDTPNKKRIAIREKDRKQSILDGDHPTDPKEGDEVYTAWV